MSDWLTNGCPHLLTVLLSQSKKKVQTESATQVVWKDWNRKVNEEAKKRECQRDAKKTADLVTQNYVTPVKILTAQANAYINEMVQILAFV